MSKPIALTKADLTRGFVYCRKYGVFYVPFGCHAQVMALLLAWDKGFSNAYDLGKSLGIRNIQDIATVWLESTPGAAYLSGVGKSIRVGSFSTLSAVEALFFNKKTAVLIGA